MNAETTSIPNNKNIINDAFPSALTIFYIKFKPIKVPTVAKHPSHKANL